MKTQRSGRLQASYLHNGERHFAPKTFTDKLLAEAWLETEERLIDLGSWTPPADRRRRDITTIEEYTKKYLAELPQSPAYRDLNETVARKRIYPLLGGKPVTDMTPAVVRAWWAGLDRDEHPTACRQAYALLRSVMNTAVADKLLPESPCQIQMKAEPERDVEALTLDELDTVANTVLPHYRLAVYTLAWTSLRFGELIELRRKDITDDGTTMKLHVRRGAARVGREIYVGKTKTARSKRPVAVPPHVAAMLREHLRGMALEDLVFTTTIGDRLSKSAFTRTLKKGYQAIGRPTLRVHDLRAVGATLAAQAGATTKELMARLGHTTPGMAMRYQMASEARDEALAVAMSQMALNAEKPLSEVNGDR